MVKINHVWFVRPITGAKVGFEFDWDDCWAEVNLLFFSFVYIWNWKQFAMADEDRAKWLNPGDKE